MCRSAWWGIDEHWPFDKDYFVLKWEHIFSCSCPIVDSCVRCKEQEWTRQTTRLIEWRRPIIRSIDTWGGKKYRTIHICFFFVSLCLCLCLSVWEERKKERNREREREREDRIHSMLKTCFDHFSFDIHRVWTIDIRKIGQKYCNDRFMATYEHVSCSDKYWEHRRQSNTWK
jgi:hypothetical protein